MNKNTLHIIGNEFTRDFFREDLIAWWTYRLSIYEHYCLASLKNQTNKNFLIFMTLKGYSVNFKERIQEILEKSGLKYLIHVIKTTSVEELLKPYFNEYNTVYHTRIDTDDMFHKDVVDEIQSYEYEYRRALIFQKGYCYDCRCNKLRHYFMPSPPFSTIMYPMNIYIDEDKKNEYKRFKSHDTLLHAMNTIPLSKDKFIVNIHNSNRITTYQNNMIVPGYSNIEISQKDINNILENFGISSNTYLTYIQK